MRPACSGEALASRKVVWGDPCTEGSETAKSGTDGQKPDKRHGWVDEYAHQCEVLRMQKPIRVDLAGIGGKTMPLPGEVSVATSWQSGEVSRGHSSREQMSRGCGHHTPEDSQTDEGLNVEMFQMTWGSFRSKDGRSPMIGGTVRFYCE